MGQGGGEGPAPQQWQEGTGKTGLGPADPAGESHLQLKAVTFHTDPCGSSFLNRNCRLKNPRSPSLVHMRPTTPAHYPASSAASGVARHPPRPCDGSQGRVWPQSARASWPHRKDRPGGSCLPAEVRPQERTRLCKRVTRATHQTAEGRSLVFPEQRDAVLAGGGRAGSGRLGATVRPWRFGGRSCGRG